MINLRVYKQSPTVKIPDVVLALKEDCDGDVSIHVVDGDGESLEQIGFFARQTGELMLNHHTDLADHGLAVDDIRRIKTR